MTTEKSIITVRRDTTTVTLTVDGRISTKSFPTQEAAESCYREYKAMIQDAEAKA